MDALVWLIFWIGGTLLNIAIADERGQGKFAFALLSLIASPVVAYAVLVAFPNRKAEARLHAAVREEADRIIAGVRT